jgi:hypothetical protein
MSSDRQCIRLSIACARCGRRKDVASLDRVCVWRNPKSQKGGELMPRRSHFALKLTVVHLYISLFFKGERVGSAYKGKAFDKV